MVANLIIHAVASRRLPNLLFAFSPDVITLLWHTPAALASDVQAAAMALSDAAAARHSIDP